MKRIASGPLSLKFHWEKFSGSRWETFLGKKKTNKHKEFWRDTPWCASRLSRGHVPSVPWYVPSVPGTFCPFSIDLHINQAQMSQVSLGRPEFVPGTPPGHPDRQIPLCDFSLSVIFSPYFRESAGEILGSPGTFQKLRGSPSPSQRLAKIVSNQKKSQTAKSTTPQNRRSTSRVQNWGWCEFCMFLWFRQFSGNPKQVVSLQVVFDKRSPHVRHPLAKHS